MSILNQLKEHSKFIKSMLEDNNLTEFDENDEQDIINTFPEIVRDNLQLALDFINNNIVPENEDDLRILFEILDYLYVDKIKDIYKKVYNLPFYQELNEYLKLEIYRYLTSFIKIACGSFHSVGLKGNGSLVCWSNNKFNELNGLPTEDKFIQIACGSIHSVALKEDGSIVCCGTNRFDQLNSPKEGKFIQIACGFCHSVGLKEDGSIVCWGDNKLKQLDNSPTEGNFIQIACGAYHSVALRDDGSIVTWGDNDDFQLDGSPTEGKFIDIACGEIHSVAIKEDGSIVSWGKNISN